MNINDIIRERPVGTKANKIVCELITKEAVKAGLEKTSLPFECMTWDKQTSFVQFGDVKVEVFPSPFSKSFIGTGKLLKIQSLEELNETEISNKIVLLHGEISKEPFMPKNFPFYYPDNHKKIIEKLENSSPKAILALTKKHPMCGLEPFPLFEDGNFDIPSAYCGISDSDTLLKLSGEVYTEINSNVEEANGEQIVVTKRSNIKKGKVIVCAHLDSKYGTPGALDNATGVFVMIEIMKRLKYYDGEYDIDFVPFNGEEYYGVKGQLTYLDYIKQQNNNIKLVINIDSPGHKDSKTSLSLYNFDSKMRDWIENRIRSNEHVTKGEEWYAGDHSMFAFQGISCIAVTSSNLSETVLDITHTPNDTKENISLDILKETSNFLTEIIESYD
ncbi:MAG: M28 family peptidase [Melioribacteraceae bacterium]|nr:M28 family peptidase [Melioribacteraceae bacterium]MCF8394420.1 M28 family peptidase [Melioribacteraceae bacterium]MCF8417484.1 M28 family peptidase [Melioribacteraceae bacterium]